VLETGVGYVKRNSATILIKANYNTEDDSFTAHSHTSLPTKYLTETTAPNTLKLIHEIDSLNNIHICS